MAVERSLGLLASGAALGIALAAAGLLAPDRDRATALPEGAVALVNGAAIRGENFERLVAGLESDTREPANADDRRHVLDRMIDEELLVQRGVELGLTQYDRRVRANLVVAVIAAVTTEAEEREPTARELRDFYAENRDFFTRPGRQRVRQIFFRVANPAEQESASARASEARQRIGAGESFADVRGALGDDEVSPLPDVALPAIKLREYLGPTALRSISSLEVGQVSQPVRSGVGFHLFEVVEREPMRTPALDQIDAQVRAEWTRRRGERALRAYLDELRDRADVSVASPLR